MNRFEPFRQMITDQLAAGATYNELAATLNAAGTTPPKGGQWTAWSSYNACRRLGLSSSRPCKAQPKAGRTARKENLQRVTNAVRRAIDAGNVTEVDLRKGAIHPTAKLLGLTSWSWRMYRRGSMQALGLQPPALGLQTQ